MNIITQLLWSYPSSALNGRDNRPEMVSSMVAVPCTRPATAPQIGISMPKVAARAVTDFAESTPSATERRSATCMGLSGLGDLMLTASSTQSRNYSLGVALGQGRALADILGERRSVAEGVDSARSVTELAGRLGIDMPICRAVAGLVQGTATIDDTISGLLSRPFNAELGYDQRS